MGAHLPWHWSADTWAAVGQTVGALATGGSLAYLAVDVHGRRRNEIWVDIGHVSVSFENGVVRVANNGRVALRDCSLVVVPIKARSAPAQRWVRERVGPGAHETYFFIPALQASGDPRAGGIVGLNGVGYQAALFFRTGWRQRWRWSGGGVDPVSRRVWKADNIDIPLAEG